MSIKVEIEWVERNKRYMTLEADSIEELSDFKPILREGKEHWSCLLYTSPSPRDGLLSRMPSSA